VEPIAVARLFRPPALIEYVEHRVFSAVPMGSVNVRQVWKPLPHDVFEVEEFESTPEGPRWREGWRVALRDEGLVHLGALPRSGAFEPWEPPWVVLPAFVAPGPVSSGIHHRGERAVERLADILPSPIPGGITVVSDTRAGPARIVMRDHFVPDFGWAGFEGLILRPTGQLRVWSEDVVVDGVRAPVAPEETDA
jgi:hypothetical protein